MATAALALAGVLSLAGAGSLALIVRHWRAVGRYVGDWWVKVVAKIVQGVAAATSIGSAAASGGEKAGWLWAAGAGTTALVIWWVSEILVDSRVKAADKLDKVELAAAQAEALSAAKLLEVFRQLADEKVRRLHEAVGEAAGAPRSVDRVAKALTPDRHVRTVLQSLAGYFALRVSEDERRVLRVRVGLYMDQAGVMTPTHGYDAKQPGVASFHSFKDKTAAGFFRRDCAADPSFVVRTANDYRTRIVPDCEVAAAAGEFTFYRPEQREYLKSLLVWYVGLVCGPGGEMAAGVLVLNADRVDFFRTEDRQDLESILQEFGTRIKLELLLDTFVSKKGK